MELETIDVPEEEAKKQSRLLKQLFKENASIAKNGIYRELQRAYGHMKHGGKIIDIFQVLKATGLDEDGNPKIAICRADAKKCYLSKQGNGSAIFSHISPDRWGRQQARKTHKEIQTPEGTYVWRNKEGSPAKSRYEIKDSEVSTIAPIIPPQILIESVKYNLKNYHILWEVEDWNVEPPRDPLLLKMITPNLFAILATWELTELERAIIKAHIVS